MSDIRIKPTIYEELFENNFDKSQNERKIIEYLAKINDENNSVQLKTYSEKLSNLKSLIIF